VPMPDRVVVNVIDVAGIIGVIADRVFPKPPLPQCIGPIAARRQRDPGGKQRLRKLAFDPPPPMRKIRIVWRQRKNGVQVFGQHDDRVNHERSFGLGLPERRFQKVNVGGEPSGLAISQHDGKEESAARDEIATIQDHGSMVAWGVADRNGWPGRAWGEVSGSRVALSVSGPACRFANAGYACCARTGFYQKAFDKLFSGLFCSGVVQF
jgi:hypothetical protein